MLVAMTGLVAFKAVGFVIRYPFLPRLLSASRLAVQNTATYVIARDIFLLACYEEA